MFPLHFLAMHADLTAPPNQCKPRNHATVVSLLNDCFPPDSSCDTVGSKGGQRLC